MAETTSPAPLSTIGCRTKKNIYSASANGPARVLDTNAMPYDRMRSLDWKKVKLPHQIATLAQFIDGDSGSSSFQEPPDSNVCYRMTAKSEETRIPNYVISIGRFKRNIKVEIKAYGRDIHMSEGIFTINFMIQDNGSWKPGQATRIALNYMSESRVVEKHTVIQLAQRVIFERILRERKESEDTKGKAGLDAMVSAAEGQLDGQELEASEGVAAG